MSTDNNPMILLELTGLSYRYGTTIYVVDQVNRTMYGKFSVGFRVINERAYAYEHLARNNPNGYTSGQINPDDSVF